MFNNNNNNNNDYSDNIIIILIIVNNIVFTCFIVANFMLNSFFYVRYYTIYIYVGQSEMSKNPCW